jgi:hypothetical protein
MRNRSLWVTAWVALAVGLAATLTGALVPSELGSLLAGYGVLCAVASAYLLAGLAIRERARRAVASRQRSPEAGSLLGRHVF